MKKPDQQAGQKAVNEKRSKNFKLALVFGVIAVGWYVLAMLAIWKQ